jgi:hypothetical protein
VNEIIPRVGGAAAGLAVPGRMSVRRRSWAAVTTQTARAAMTNTMCWAIAW